MWLLLAALLLIALSLRAQNSAKFDGAYKYCPGCAKPLRLQNLEGKQKLACQSCAFVHWNNPVPVAVVLIPHGRGLVLVKRKHEPAKGKFALPAGFVDTGESPHEAACREALEETGLKIKIAGLLDVITRPVPNHVLHFYLAEPMTEAPQAGSDAEEVMIAEPGSMPETLAFESHAHIIQKYFQEKLALR